MKKRIFPIISASFFAIFAVHAVYLFNERAYMLCTKIVLEPDVGYYSKYIGITPEAIPSIIAAVFIALTLIILIVRVICPNLTFGIIGSVMAVI